MALLEYLKAKKKTHEESLLNSKGPLNEHLSSEAIRKLRNKEINLVVLKESSKRLPYLKATPEQKAIIGKHAAENKVYSMF